MKLAFGNSGNTPDSRIADVALLWLAAAPPVVWVWAPQLSFADSATSLFLYDEQPLHGFKATKLGSLSPECECDGLAMLQIQKGTFDVNFAGKSVSQGGQPLAPGQTLRAALRIADVPKGDLDGLISVASYASANLSTWLGKVSLREYLDTTIVVADMEPSETQGTPVSDTAGLRSSGARDKLFGLPRISLWSPGTTNDEFVGFYEPILGSAETSRLWQMHRASVAAVAAGDFAEQVALGKFLAEGVPEDSILAGEGAYFAAEGLRLLADLESMESRKSERRANATAQYQRAAELLPGDPRPLRGLGRIAELGGDFGGALEYFTIAKGLCLVDRSKNATVPKLDLAHEVLRTTRHFIHCLLDIRASSTASVWHRTHKEHELEGYLHECENLHHELMPNFESDPAWYSIEWFMGLVFLAKAWGALGNAAKLQTDLAFALEARRKLMTLTGPLSAVERANLEWWIAVARGFPDKVDADFLKRADLLDRALQSADNVGIATAVDEIVRPFIAPWQAK